MGWKQDMGRRVAQLEVDAIVTRHNQGQYQAKTNSRLSALEAKAGEGKGCACKYWTAGVDFANGKDSTSVFVYKPDPVKPYSRIPMSCVPVGRLFVYGDRVYRKPAHRGWSCQGYSVTSECGKSHSYIGESLEVTLLPEDYEPGRKAESKPKTVGAKWDHAGLVTVLVDGEARLVFNPSTAKIGYMEVPIQ